MKRISLAGSLIAMGLFAAVPVSAQTVGIGSGGVGVDLRTNCQCERGIDREEVRRGEHRDQRFCEEDGEPRRRRH